MDRVETLPDFPWKYLLLIVLIVLLIQLNCLIEQRRDEARKKREE